MPWMSSTPSLQFQAGLIVFFSLIPNLKLLFSNRLPGTLKNIWKITKELPFTTLQTDDFYLIPN